MRFKHACGALAIASAASLAGAAAAAAQDHPLDPLTFQEYWTVLEVLQREDRLDEGTVFYNVSLMEPDKALVWAFADVTRSSARPRP